MSSNFLQRFKGKTTQLGKEGLLDVVRDTGGLTNTNVIVQTNINFKPTLPSNNEAAKIQRHSSSEVRAHPQDIQSKEELKRKPYPPPSNGRKEALVTKPTEQCSAQPSEPSPFFIANPFRMDDDEPAVELKLASKKAPQAQPKQTEKEERRKPMADMKQTVKTVSSRGLSCDAKKNTSKEWVKLGGLGANIGGEQWQEKKKKLDKMQEFAQQVKAANSEKLKERKPNDEEEEDKKAKREKNVREKALEYCKNIPKPPKKAAKKEECVPAGQTPKEEQAKPHALSQLEMYEMRHQQLQKLLNQT